jgi:hypothetical protein
MNRFFLSAVLLVAGGRAASTAPTGRPFGHELRSDFLFEPNSTQFNQ